MTQENKPVLQNAPRETLYIKARFQWYFLCKDGHPLNKFITGVSSFGYDCYKILLAAFKILKNNQYNSFLEMFIV